MSTLRRRYFLPTTPDRDVELRHRSWPPIPSPSPPSAATDARATFVYTSLRELILSSPPSRYASPTAAGFEIRIRNPLVKQAAYAYLQMTPSPIRNQRPHRRFLAAFKDALRPLQRCLGFIGRLLCCSQFCSPW
ncbi:uncharacterized protein LOC110025405 [Phalaenopsis equestris]|uniref:uncharacterized protein LOC110025405 n=1 Tax=Phalaenopsis equestris TaxID=78828 RepID=UPI0009E48BB5|nr:uncharacterized protein LOC110025405 [Phalaenopsis equestris]